MSKPIDQEREAFEAAVTKDGWPHADRIDRASSGDYCLPRVQNKWLGWQLARAQQPAGVTVPEGWKLVPAAVTGRIVLAMERNGVPDGTDAEMLWDAMLAAAPHPVSGDLIRFDFINADGNPDSKMITHDEMRERCAAHRASQQQYTIGDLTFERVFKAAGLTNLSDLQAVLDQVERALAQEVQS